MATLDTILNIRVEGTDQMVKLKSAIDQTSTELKELKEGAKQAGANQKDFNAKIVTAETKLKGLRGQLNASKTDLIKNAKAAADSSKSYNSLTKQNAVLSSQLRKLADPLGKNSKEFEKLSAKIRTNTTALKNMDAAMGRQQRNVGNYKQSIGSVVTAVGAAIIAFKTFQRVLGTFVDFEFQIKQVGVISGATAAEMEMLSDSAKALGASTAFTAGEVAGLQKELAKLGFNPAEIEAMTSATLDLAFAFGNDIAETGEIVGVVLNSYKMEASEATRVTDVLAKAFASTALDLQKFNVAFPKVGAIASQLGFSLEGTTALLGELANSGLEASTAGTSLRSIFLKLADSNSALSQTLGGSVTSIDQLLPALNDLFESGADVEEMLGLTDKRSVTAFATLASGATDVAVLTDSLENSAGTASKFADVMRDSLKGSLDAATSAANGMVIELFEALSPAITLIVDAMGLLFNVISAVIENIKAITIGMGAYAAVMVASSIAQGTFVTSLVSSKAVTIAWNLVTKAARALQIAWNVAVMSNPIGALVGVITTGIAILWSWNSATAEGTEEQEGLNQATKDQAKELTALQKIRKKNNDQQKQEISQLGALKETIKNSNLALHEREKALKEFNKLAGTNISNLQSEKDIVDQLEKGYNSAVDAIKRKIILQSTEEQVTELIAKQMALQEELEQKQDRLNKEKEKQIALDNQLIEIENERASVGARSTEELIDQSSERSDAILSENQRFRNDITATMTLENDRTSNVAANITILTQELEREGEAIEANTTIRENANLSLQASDTGVINVLKDKNEQTEITNQATNDVISTNAALVGITNQINELYAKQNKVLSGLNLTTNQNSFATGKVTTEYRKLQDAVKDSQEELKKQVTLGQQRLAEFLASDEAQLMSAKEKEAKISELESETETLVTNATNNVIEAKQNLIVVDNELAKANEVVSSSLTTNIQKLIELRAAGQKVIDADKEQLAVLKALEDAGADVAKERIRLALKVAKAELDLALKTAQASDMSTQEQIDNIKRLKGEIEGFENELANTEGTGGFMNKMLFGTNEEDGGAFTGEDLVNSIQMSLSVVDDIMTGFNELQQEQLNARLGVIQGEKEAEVKAYENSAEFEVATEEERATKIEEIEKKHDDAMLALKIEQFKKDQKLQIAQAVIGGAQAVLGILKGEATGNVIADAIIKGVLIAATIATTALQIATIKAQQPPTAELGGVMDDSFFKLGGMVYGKSHAQGGEKFSVGGRVAELEGGEAVINKRSTAMFKPILSQMNVAGGGRKFADGGLVFSEIDSLATENPALNALAENINNQQVLLVEADVTASQKAVKNIESRISF